MEEDIELPPAYDFVVRGREGEGEDGEQRPVEGERGGYDPYLSSTFTGYSSSSDDSSSDSSDHERIENYLGDTRGGLGEGSMEGIVGAGGGGGEGFWTCGLCFMDNLPELQICASCSEPRRAEPQEGPPPAAQPFNHQPEPQVDGIHAQDNGHNFTVGKTLGWAVIYYLGFGAFIAFFAFTMVASYTEVASGMAIGLCVTYWIVFFTLGLFFGIGRESKLAGLMFVLSLTAALIAMTTITFVAGPEYSTLFRFKDGDFLKEVDPGIVPSSTDATRFSFILGTQVYFDLRGDSDFVRTNCVAPLMANPSQTKAVYWVWGTSCCSRGCISEWTSPNPDHHLEAVRTDHETDSRLYIHAINHAIRKNRGIAESRWEEAIMVKLVDVEDYESDLVKKSNTIIFVMTIGWPLLLLEFGILTAPCMLMFWKCF